MRVPLLVSLPLCLLLAGCPEPEDQLPQNAPPVGSPGGPPPDGAPQGDAGGTPGSPDAAPPPPSDLASRTLASLANGGPTVKIRGTIKGATTAQVDFTALTVTDGQNLPDILQIIQVTDGKFEVFAPATYDREIYVSAVVDVDGNGPDPSDSGGMAASPIKLEGKDVTVEIDIAAGGWLEKAPWAVAGAPPPVNPAPEGAPLADGAAPGGPPPADGAAPGGPPPADGAAPGGASPPAGAAPQ